MNVNFFIDRYFFFQFVIRIDTGKAKKNTDYYRYFKDYSLQILIRIKVAAFKISI